MADAAFRPSSATQSAYQNQQQQQQRLFSHRTASPVGNSHIGFRTREIASPTRSPGASSPAFSMYNHGPQSHSLLNGNRNHQFQSQMNVSKHFSNHNAQFQTQQQSGHVTPLPQQSQQAPPQSQQENGSSRGGLSYGNHQHTVSTGTLSSATPHFTPSHLQNSAPGSSSRPNTEHWTQQIRLAQVSREATQPHYYARSSPGVNKQPLTTLQPAGGSSLEDADDIKPKPPTTSSKPGGQAWASLDFSGQGLRSIANSLFKYNFLENLYFNNNRLSWLTPQISQLRNLAFLDLSGNQLHSLPGEIGMLSNLKRLLLFDNHLETLPFEMGYLWRLEFLGVEGNPLSDELKNIVAEGGPKSLIRYMREQADGALTLCLRSPLANLMQSSTLLLSASGTPSMRATSRASTIGSRSWMQISLQMP